MASARARVQLPSSLSTRIKPHDTAGLPGFPANDIFGQAGEPVYAPVAGRMVYVHTIPWDQKKRVGGETAYLQGANGRTYFLTHLAGNVPAGQVTAGQEIGQVAAVPNNWWQPHVHEGVHEGIYQPGQSSPTPPSVAPAPAGSPWQQLLATELGVPYTPQTRRFFDAWHQAEGGSASFNPFNTTQPYQGATNYNSVGVRNYPSLQAGLAATVQTLRNGRYGPILTDLRRGSPATQLAADVAASPWGTGAGVQRVLASGAPQAAALAGPAPAQSGAVGPAPTSQPRRLPAAVRQALAILRT